MIDRPTHAARLPGRVRFLLATLGLLFLLSASTKSALAGEGRGIDWRTDFNAARAEAQSRNLPLWVQFTGPWCLYCRLMDQNAFVQPGIVARSQSQFVPVKLRADVYEDLVAHFGVTSLPTTIILSPSGKMILGRTKGYNDAGSFAVMLDGAWSNALADPGILALAGNCPVRLVEGKGRVQGDPRLAVFHDGHAYRFADQQARDLFLKDPEHYLPSDGGLCVVTHKEKKSETPGDPKFGATYNGRLYLFIDLDARAKFAAHPDDYTSVDLADNGLCPHCRTSENKTVAGKPEFTATHFGKRYLFPDDTHRQAFRAAPDRYIR